MRHCHLQGARQVLESIPYAANEVFVHSDERLMPKLKDTWASWNFLGRSDSSEEGCVCVSYWGNRLQTLPEAAPDIFVTLNPITEPQEKKVYRRLTLAHPIFSFASYKAQQRLPEIQVRLSCFICPGFPGRKTLHEYLHSRRLGCQEHVCKPFQAISIV